MSVQSAALRDHDPVRPPNTTAARERRDTIATVILVAGVVAFVVYANWLQRDTWFWMDDFHWLITFHDGHLLDASNGHLMVVPGAFVYASLQLFGFEHAYLPLRLFALAVLVGLAVVVWRHVRQRTGPAVATAAALAVLWFAPNEIDAIYPSFVNHSLPLLLTVVVAGRLDRSRPTWRQDVITTLLIAAAVSCSSTGLVVLAVVAAHIPSRRTRPERWWLLCSPGAAWLLWYATIGGDPANSGSDRAVVPTTREAFAHADGLVRMTFVDLGAGNPAVGYLLGIGFIVVMVLSATRWKTCTRASVRWIVAAVAFIALTSLILNGTRVYFGEPARYRLVLATFLILAVAECLHGVVVDQRFVVAAGVVVGASSLVLIDGLQEQHHFLTEINARNAPMLLGAEAAGAGVDRDRILSDLSFDDVSVGQYLDLVEHAGSPRDYLVTVEFRPETADAADRVLRSETLIDVSSGTCNSGDSVPASRLTVPPGTTVVARSIGTASRVFVARFGGFASAMKPLVVLESGDSVVIEVPNDPVSIPWQLQGTTGAVLAVC